MGTVNQAAKTTATSAASASIINHSNIISTNYNTPKDEDINNNHTSTHEPSSPLKLTDILAAEIAGDYFRDIDLFGDVAHNDGVHQVYASANIVHNNDEMSRDLDDLIQLSKQMQHDLRHDTAAAGGSFTAAQHTKRGSAAAGLRMQPTGMAHRAFLVPPLFVNDEHVLESYTRDLVGECFDRSNGVYVSTVEVQPQPKGIASALAAKQVSVALSVARAQVTEIPDDMHLEIPPLKSVEQEANDGDRIEGISGGCKSAKSLLSTRTHSPRAYPKKHSCIHFTVPPKRVPRRKVAAAPLGGMRPRSQSARILRNCEYYDFRKCHPDWAVVQTTDSVFPKRVERIAAEAHCSPTKEPEIHVDDNVDVERSDVQKDNIAEKLEAGIVNNSGIAKSISPSQTWHDLLEINVTKSTRIERKRNSGSGLIPIDVEKEVLEKPTQTSPLSVVQIPFNQADE